MAEVDATVGVLAEITGERRRVDIAGSSMLIDADFTSLPLSKILI
ncbi:MAG: hypothetical protein ACRDRL_28805 [Sciscionella sp.]